MFRFESEPTILYNGDLTFPALIFTAVFLLVLQLLTCIHSVIQLGHISGLVFGLGFFFPLFIALFYFFCLRIVTSVTSRVGKGKHVSDKPLALFLFDGTHS